MGGEGESGGQAWWVRAVVPWGAAAGSGLALTGAFHPWNQPWLAWLFVMPMIWVMRWRPARGWREAAAWGWVAGVVHFGTSLAWVGEVTWAGWAVLVVLMACYPAVWAVVMGEALRRMPEAAGPHHSLGVALISASAWCGLEWVRGWLLTGFPWNPVGASQVEMLVLAQVAELGGVGLISWMVVFGGSVLALTVMRMVRQATGQGPVGPRLEFLAALTVVGVAVWFGAGRLARPAEVRGQVEVLLVQPRIPQDPWGAGMEAGEALARSIQLTELALPPGMPVDVVVWPETPIPEALADLPGFEAFVRDLVPARARAMVYGTIRREGRVPYNSAMLALPGASAAVVYDKMHLVMMGEYVPLAEVFPFLRWVVPLGTDFAPGVEPVVFPLPGGWKAAPLICFEDVMARVVRRFVPLEPDLLLNLTNDGWFNDSPQSMQHFQLARLRCIELRLPMVRVANNGATGWIDERGVVRELLRDPETGSVDMAGTVRTRVALPERRETVYARWGDWPGAGSALLISGLGLWWGIGLRRRRRRE